MKGIIYIICNEIVMSKAMQKQNLSKNLVRGNTLQGRKREHWKLNSNKSVRIPHTMKGSEMKAFQQKN